MPQIPKNNDQVLNQGPGSNKKRPIIMKVSISIEEIFRKSRNMTFGIEKRSSESETHYFEFMIIFILILI